MITWHYTCLFIDLQYLISALISHIIGSSVLDVAVTAVVAVISIFITAVDSGDLLGSVVTLVSVFVPIVLYELHEDAFL
jgi:hypothetical protein